MKLIRLFLACLCIAISTTAFSQDIFTNTNFSGIVTSTGDITIHPGATLTLDPNTTLRMLAGSRITIRDGGRLFVNRGSTIQGLNGNIWDGLRIDPTPITLPDSGPAVIMIGGPTWVDANIINFQDANIAIRSSGDNTERLRGFQLYGVDFTNCRNFFLYVSTADTPNSISSTASVCNFIGDANTTITPSVFIGISDLNITASEFVEANTNTLSNLIMLFDCENIVIERNQFLNNGVEFLSSYNNIRITSNQFTNPQSGGVDMQSDLFAGSSEVTINNNSILGNSTFNAPAIRVLNTDNVNIQANTIFNRQIGISCGFIGGTSEITGNNIGFCNNLAITIQTTFLDALGDGLIIKCNNLVANGTAIQIRNLAQLPIHLMEWNGYTIETDPGNRFLANNLDIENQNTNFTWVYHVIDASDQSLNPPVTTSGLVNLVDLQNEGRYACDGGEFAETPGEEVGSRDADASRLGKAASSIAPNPAREAFQLTLAEQWLGQQLAIDIIDISGKVLQQLPVRKYEDSNIHISTHDLQAGYYFCRISVTAQQPEVIKLIIVD